MPHTSFQTFRARFAGAGRTTSLGAPVHGMSADSIRPIFAGIWHGSMRSQSVILAQAASLSLKQRRLFLLEVAKLVDPSLGMEPRAAERDAAMRGKEICIPGGRFYIFLRSRDFVVAGFEDEKAAAYQGKSFLRYDEYLRARNPHPLLVFFSRDLHTPTGEQAKKFRRFVPVDDGRFVGWADECLIDWLGNAERQLGQASERVRHCFANAPASNSAPHMAALQGFAG
jgi:hypothetical protein